MQNNWRYDDVYDVKTIPERTGTRQNVNFEEALKSQRKNSSRIKLVNGEILEGKILEVSGGMVKVEMKSEGAGSPNYYVPLSSILYVSDCELKK